MCSAVRCSGGLVWAVIPIVNSGGGARGRACGHGVRWGEVGGGFGSLYLMTKITNPHVSDSNSSQVIMIDETVSEKIDIQMH